MDEKERLAYINTLTLKDCLSILALSAPDFLEQVAAYVCQDPASPAALAKARAAVVEAMERESRPNKKKPEHFGFSFCIHFNFLFFAFCIDIWCTIWYTILNKRNTTTTGGIS